MLALTTYSKGAPFYNALSPVIVQYLIRTRFFSFLAQSALTRFPWITVSVPLARHEISLQNEATYNRWVNGLRAACSGLYPTGKLAVEFEAPSMTATVPESLFTTYTWLVSSSTTMDDGYCPVGTVVAARVEPSITVTESS